MSNEGLQIKFVAVPTAVNHPAFPPMYDTKGDFTDSLTASKRGREVTRALTNITRTAGSPTEESRRALLLATNYFLNFSFDKAALVLEGLYSDKVITSEGFFDRASEAIVQKRGILSALEKSRGSYKDYRLTLGGLLEPGLRISCLNEEKAFALHSVKEALMGAIRNGDPDKNPNLLHLAAIFPQFKPVSKSADTKPPFNFQTADLGKIHTCCSTD